MSMLLISVTDKGLKHFCRWRNWIGTTWNQKFRNLQTFLKLCFLRDKTHCSDVVLHNTPSLKNFWKTNSYFWLSSLTFRCSMNWIPISSSPTPSNTLNNELSYKLKSFMTPSLKNFWKDKLSSCLSSLTCWCSMNWITSSSPTPSKQPHDLSYKLKFVVEGVGWSWRGRDGNPVHWTSKC